MLKLATALLAVVCARACCAAACGAELRGAQTLDSPDYQVAYRTQPATIAVGRHFALEFVVCAKGRSPSAEGVTVDAYMPEHAHGMNYKATVSRIASVQPAGNVRFRAEGLLFHMPGRWEIIFDVAAAGRAERLARSIVLE